MLPSHRKSGVQVRGQVLNLNLRPHPSKCSLVTKQHWAFRGDVNLQPNNTYYTAGAINQGEGFTGRGPDGTTWRFDWLVNRNAERLPLDLIVVGGLCLNGKGQRQGSESEGNLRQPGEGVKEISAGRRNHVLSCPCTARRGERCLDTQRGLYAKAAPSPAVNFYGLTTGGRPICARNI